MKKTLALVGLGLTVPYIVSAQATILTILTMVKDILDFLIPVLITIAVIVFFWGLIKYIMSAGDSEKQGEARNMMIWGVIILFVIIAVWGLVSVLQETFDIKTAPDSIDLTDTPVIPQDQ